MSQWRTVFLLATLKYLFKRFHSDEKIFYWHYLSIFPITFYFLEMFKICIYFILYCLTEYLCIVVWYSVLFWFIYKLGNVELRVIHTSITLNFPFPNRREDFECSMLFYRKQPEVHLIATSWRHVMNAI